MPPVYVVEESVPLLIWPASARTSLYGLGSDRSTVFGFASDQRGFMHTVPSLIDWLGGDLIGTPAP